MVDHNHKAINRVSDITLESHQNIDANTRTDDNRVLLVDDDLFIAEFLHEFFATYKVELDVAEDPESAKNFVEKCDYKMVLVDVTLGMNDGTILAKHIEACDSAPPVVMFTGMSREWVQSKYNCRNYLQKPFRIEELKTLMSKFDIIDNAEIEY